MKPLNFESVTVESLTIFYDGDHDGDGDGGPVVDDGVSLVAALRQCSNSDGGGDRAVTRRRKRVQAP
jgi:hypothetical protein